MLKRTAVLGVVGIFLAVPPAIAKSSSNVKSPAAKRVVAKVFAPHHVGQCPNDRTAADL